MTGTATIIIILLLIFLKTNDGFKTCIHKDHAYKQAKHFIIGL